MTTLNQISRLRKQVEALESRVKSQPRRRRLSEQERIEMLNTVKQELKKCGRSKDLADAIALGDMPEYVLIPSLEEQQRHAELASRAKEILAESRRIRAEQEVKISHREISLPEPITAVDTAPEVEESLVDFEAWLEEHDEN